MDSPNCESVHCFTSPPGNTEHCMPITSEKVEKELFCVVQYTHLTLLIPVYFLVYRPDSDGWKFIYIPTCKECEAFCNAYRTVRWDYFFYFIPKRWNIIFALFLSEKINWPLVHQGVQVNLETLCIRLAWNYFPWFKKKWRQKSYFITNTSRRLFLSCFGI